MCPSTEDRHSGRTTSADHLSALVIGSRQSERSQLEKIFRSAGWRLYSARNCQAAVRCLDQNPVQIVISECNLPGCDWKEILRSLGAFSPPPLLIVTSRLADDSLWAEVLNLGGYDVLAQPFDREEILRVIGAARRHFDSEGRRMSAAAAAAVPAARIA